MEENPVREKHKTAILKGSNGYSLVHSEVKTQETQIQKGEKKNLPSYGESTLPFACLSSWVAGEILNSTF